MKLIVNNLAFAYKDEPLWQNVSFTLGKGEVMTVLGSNGIGKTTLLRVLIGFFKPLPGGSVHLVTDAGESFTPYANPKEFTEQIGYVPQVQNTAYSFQVRDYVVMGRAPHLGVFAKPKQEDYELTDEVLDDLGIYRVTVRSIRSRAVSSGRQLLPAPSCSSRSS